MQSPDGRDLEVRCIAARDPSRPTMVLLHEGLGSVSHWRDFPDRLAEATGCAVFLYSRYGYGNSTVLAEPRDVSYMHVEAHVVLPAVLATAGILHPILLGHSDGTSIALLYAAAFPECAAGLILEAPHVFVEDVSVENIRKAKTAFETTDLPKKLARYHADAERTFRGWNDIWLDPRFRSWNIESGLENIRCPVLILHGQDDEYGTVAQIDAIRARITPARAVLLPQCRHAPHRDQCAATLEEIQAFLATL